MTKKRNIRKDGSNSRLGPFEIGQIVSLARQGLNQRDIGKEVEREDGSFGVGFGSVGRVLRKRKREPS